MDPTFVFVAPAVCLNSTFVSAPFVARNRRETTGHRILSAFLISLIYSKSYQSNAMKTYPCVRDDRVEFYCRQQLCYTRATLNSAVNCSVLSTRRDETCLRRLVKNTIRQLRTVSNAPRPGTNVNQTLTPVNDVYTQQTLNS